MYRIPATHEPNYAHLDVPNVLYAIDGFVYKDEYTHEPHIVVAYKDHYVDYEWHEDGNACYWVDAREISAAEFATKPYNVTEAKKEMYFHLAEKWSERSAEITRMSRYGYSS